MTRKCDGTFAYIVHSPKASNNVRYSYCLLPAGHCTDHVTCAQDGKIYEWPNQ